MIQKEVIDEKRPLLLKISTFNFYFFLVFLNKKINTLLIHLMILFKYKDFLFEVVLWLI